MPLLESEADRVDLSPGMSVRHCRCITGLDFRLR